MKKKKKLLITTGFALIAFFIAIFLWYDHVHYKHSADNIFEIPKTYDLWQSGNTLRYEKYFFIQNPPKSQQELASTIEDFIKQNKIFEDAESNSAGYMALNFMIPDYKLPIYFEDNSNYFKMDDHIEHYVQSNRIALYTYDFEENTESLTISQAY